MGHDLPCDWKAGFVMDPTKKQRVGYLVAFEGLAMQDYLKKDIEVFSPYNNSETGYAEAKVDPDSKKITVVGVIKSFSFGGGVGGPICISAYISAQNQEQIKATLKAATLKSTIVKKNSPGGS